MFPGVPPTASGSPHSYRAARALEHLSRRRGCRLKLFFVEASGGEFFGGQPSARGFTDEHGALSAIDCAGEVEHADQPIVVADGLRRERGVGSVEGLLRRDNRRLKVILGQARSLHFIRRDVPPRVFAA